MGQIDRYFHTLVHDCFVHRRDVIPIEVSGRSELEQFAEEAVLCHKLNTQFLTRTYIEIGVFHHFRIRRVHVFEVLYGTLTVFPEHSCRNGMSLPCLEVVQFQVIGVRRKQIYVAEADVCAIREVHSRVDLVSPRAVYTAGVIKLQLVSVSEIITDIGAREELEIGRVLLIGECCIGILNSSETVFVFGF